MEVVIKIEVKDNNVEQALRVLKRKLQRDGFFKIIKLKNTYEKPSEKKKRILQENIKRVKKLNKLNDQKDLYIYCKSGIRSARVCEYLLQKDFKNVYNVKGGIVSWSRDIDQTIKVM